MSLSESTPRDYWALLKPRVMALVIFTGLVGLVLEPSGRLHLIQSAMVLLAIALAAGAAGALNMWYDRDIDALMERTKTRPGCRWTHQRRERADFWHSGCHGGICVDGVGQ